MADDRNAVSTYSKLIWDQGWVANHDGNITVLEDGGRMLATPTAVSKRLIPPGDVLLLDSAGKVLEGRLKPFSELVLHRVAYRVRDDVRAVIHAHPPTASGFAMAGEEVDPTITPEAIVSIGDRIPMIPHGMPGAPELLEAVGEALYEFDAITLGSHGVVTVGVDLEQAYLRMELVEHLAKMALVARQVGRVNRVRPDEVQALLAKRAKAGLGLAGRQAARHAAPATPTPAPAAGADLAAVIAAEIKAALG